MRLILLHGQGRSSWSMRLLGERLRRRGHQVQYLGYSTRRERFAQIQQRLIATIEAGRPEQPYALIGHSLGSILVRASLPALEHHPPAQLVMLAPPNQPPRLARLLRHNPVYRRLTGDCGQRLASEQFYATLPLPSIPTTVIAGTGGPRGRWSPFGDELNDGVVSVGETRLGPGHEPILLPVIHTFIMNSRVALQIILDCLSDVAEPGEKREEA